jgi:hypothetical protein
MSAEETPGHFFLSIASLSGFRALRGPCGKNAVHLV